MAILYSELLPGNRVWKPKVSIDNQVLKKAKGYFLPVLMSIDKNNGNCHFIKEY